MRKLAIITTHPIQYNAPLFQLLKQRGKIEIYVYYTWGQSKDVVYDARFGVERNWDIPLLDGYAQEFVQNISVTPDSNKFFGVITPGLKKKLIQKKYDAVLIYRWSVWSHFFLMLSKWKTTKLWFRGDSHLQTVYGNSIKNFFKRKLLSFIYSNVDRVFYAGSMNKRYFSYYGVEDNKLLFMPHAVDNIRFINEAKQYEQKAKEERLRLGITDTDIVFLYAGKFYDIKNLLLLISAFQKLNGAQYRLLLFGSGEQEDQLKEYAASDKRILFQPFQNQSAMPFVYRIGDVYVLPSKSETWGLGVNEAMACGLPAIVSTTCGCAPELIINNETGFTFDGHHEMDLLKQLQRFTNRNVASEMGVKAQKHIQQFSLEQQAKVIEESLL